MTGIKSANWGVEIWVNGALLMKVRQTHDLPHWAMNMPILG